MALGNQLVLRFPEYQDSPPTNTGRNRDATESPFSGPCGLSHDRVFTTGSGFEKRNVKGAAPRRQPGEKHPPPPCPASPGHAFFPGVFPLPDRGRILFTGVTLRVLST